MATSYQILIVAAFVLLANDANSYDYIAATEISTQEESCRMYREFDLAECEKQAATVRDSFNRPRCNMWDRQRESALLDCDGKSPRALMDKRVEEERSALQRDATHILVDKGRLVCRSEESLRETYNSIINNEPGTPHHIRSEICRVLQYETIVKITATSDDEKVVAIDYLNNFALKRHGFTVKGWLVTKERFQEILAERKAGQL